METLIMEKFRQIYHFIMLKGHPSILYTISLISGFPRDIGVHTHNLIRVMPKANLPLTHQSIWNISLECNIGTILYIHPKTCYTSSYRL